MLLQKAGCVKLSLAKQPEWSIIVALSGRSAARLARSNRDAEVRGSNPRAPTARMKPPTLGEWGACLISASALRFLPERL